MLKLISGFIWRIVVLSLLTIIPNILIIWITPSQNFYSNLISASRYSLGFGVGIIWGLFIAWIQQETRELKSKGRR